MFRSATFKLTLWYQAIVMTISLIFSVVVYHFATNELTVGLHHQTQRIYDDFPVFEGNPLLRPGRDLAIASHHILLRLVYFNILVLLLAGFASYFLARRTLRPIEIAHEQQKRFTADVSHELRTPLTSLKMGSEITLMDKQADKKSLREALQSNLEDANTMDSLINNLLKLTKLDADEVTADFKAQSVKAIAEAAILQLQRKLETKHITIQNDIKNHRVIGDTDSLVQLFVILLDNAIKYSAPNSPVHISSRHLDNTVEISIRDEGQGIAPEALPHVFDRFYRADASRSKASGEGFGLGLSIAKMITDRHHGSLTLRSRYGHGTTAVITLPSPIASD